MDTVSERNHQSHHGSLQQAQGGSTSGCSSVKRDPTRPDTFLLPISSLRLIIAAIWILIIGDFGVCRCTAICFGPALIAAALTKPSDNPPKDDPTEH